MKTVEKFDALCKLTIFFVLFWNCQKTENTFFPSVGHRHFIQLLYFIAMKHLKKKKPLFLVLLAVTHLVTSFYIYLTAAQVQFNVNSLWYVFLQYSLKGFKKVWVTLGGCFKHRSRSLEAARHPSCLHPSRLPSSVLLELNFAPGVPSLSPLIDGSSPGRGVQRDGWWWIGRGRGLLWRRRFASVSKFLINFWYDGPTVLEPVSGPISCTLSCV